MMGTMDDFEHFVKGLGPHAKQYSPAQLKLLHVEVRKLAETLLEIYRVRTAKKRQGSPQAVLDGSGDDRTIESVLTERVDGPDPPQAQDL
jgi:hypothetical protein